MPSSSRLIQACNYTDYMYQLCCHLCQILAYKAHSEYPCEPAKQEEVDTLMGHKDTYTGSTYIAVHTQLLGLNFIAAAVCWKEPLLILVS